MVDELDEIDVLVVLDVLMVLVVLVVLVVLEVLVVVVDVTGTVVVVMVVCVVVDAGALVVVWASAATTAHRARMQSHAVAVIPHHKATGAGSAGERD